LIDRADVEGRPFSVDGIEAPARQHPGPDAGVLSDLAGAGITDSGLYTIQDDILLMSICIPTTGDHP